MELKALAGAYSFQLTDWGQTPPTNKTGTMTFDEKGKGTYVLANYPQDVMPCQILGGIDLPPLQANNVGRLTFNMHQSSGKIDTDLCFSVTNTGHMLIQGYAQGSQVLGTADKT